MNPTEIAAEAADKIMRVSAWRDTEVKSEITSIIQAACEKAWQEGYDANPQAEFERRWRKAQAGEGQHGSDGMPPLRGLAHAEERGEVKDLAAEMARKIWDLVIWSGKELHYDRTKSEAEIAAIIQAAIEKGIQAWLCDKGWQGKTFEPIIKKGIQWTNH